MVVGGSGHVGSLVVPDLANGYTVRVLDPRPPVFNSPVEYARGSSTDFGALTRAFEGVDAFIYMAMGPKDPAVWGQPDNTALHFDMAVKGVYLTMRAAREAGVTRGVYASSMSVFAAYPDESRAIGDETPDATDFYGLAKRLGEEVIKAAITEHPASVMALRLCLPMSNADWLAATDPLVVTVGTAGTDVSSAFRAALAWCGVGFDAVTISGDRGERYSELSRARTVLGWEPKVIHPLWQRSANGGR